VNIVRDSLRMLIDAFTVRRRVATIMKFREFQKKEA